MTKRFSPKSVRRAVLYCGVALAGMFTLAIAGSDSAKADWNGYGHHRWHEGYGGYHGYYHGGWWGPHVVVTAPGYYYAPPPPPPEYYRPAYEGYPAGVGIYFPIR